MPRFALHAVCQFVVAALTAWSALIAQDACAVTFDQALTGGAATPIVLGLQQAQAVRTALDAELPHRTGNPELTAGVGPSLPGPGVSLLLGAAQSWSLADLAGARNDAARSERAVLAAEVRLQVLQGRLAVAEAWLRTWWLQRALDLAQQEAQVAVDLADSVTRSVQRGVLTAGDGAEARMFAAEMRLQLLNLEGDLATASRELARWSGQPSTGSTVDRTLFDHGQPIRADGPPPRPQLPDAQGWSAMIARVASLPQVTVRRLQATADRAREVELAAAQASFMSAGGQLQINPSGDLAILATLSMRWSAFDKGQRQRAVALEAAARQDGEAKEAAHALGHQFALTWHEVENTRETEAVLARELLPAVQDLVQARAAGWKRGTGTLFDLLRARRARLEMERRYAQAQGERAWAEVKAWLLAGALEVP